jgi:hypothetical protein
VKTERTEINYEPHQIQPPHTPIQITRALPNLEKKRGNEKKKKPPRDRVDGEPHPAVQISRRRSDLGTGGGERRARMWRRRRGRHHQPVGETARHATNYLFPLLLFRRRLGSVQFGGSTRRLACAYKGRGFPHPATGLTQQPRSHFFFFPFVSFRRGG